MQDMALMQWLVAAHKLKPPVRQVVWLGIKVDLNENTVSVLPKKFKDPARLGRPIAPTGTESSPPSHWTKINHLATVIKPSHVFMGKLLTCSLPCYNGKVIIPPEIWKREMWVDTCVKGAKAVNDKSCYSYPFPESMTKDQHITNL